jgi:Acyltransferase family
MTNALNSPGNWRPTDTAFMRTAAALLIANSHLEHFYPAHPWLAGDGLLGNSLFYFLSGFGVALGASSRNRGFFRWYGRRISRIYPSVILAVIVIQLLILGLWRQFTLLNYFQSMIWPTSYGFVGHIMLVYIVLYWLLKFRSRGPHIAVVVGMFAAFLFCAVRYAIIMSPGQSNTPEQFRWAWLYYYFYFSGIALLGALLAPATSRPRSTFARDAFLFVITFAFYVAAKFEMVTGHFSRGFILLDVLSVFLVLLMLRISAADALQNLFAQIRPLGWAVSLLAGLTLEMYIVQDHASHDFPRIIDLRSPLNLVVFWIVTIVGAWALSIGAGIVRKLLAVPRSSGPFPSTTTPTN